MLVGYPSGQRGQTVNLLAYAFDGSNPSPTTIFLPAEKGGHTGSVLIWRMGPRCSSPASSAAQHYQA